MRRNTQAKYRENTVPNMRILPQYWGPWFRYQIILLNTEKMLRIATYNLNNLFERASVLELEGFSPEAKNVLNDITTLQSLLSEDDYSGATGKSIVLLIKKYFGANGKKENNFFYINEVKNKLYGISGGELVLKPEGRQDWLGWIELKKQSVNDIATQNTARVVKTVDADIMCVVEVENRTALGNFNKFLLDNHYKYNLLIDGNDNRGIDVGILSQHEIVNIETHIYDSYKDSNGRTQRIFSRDCAHYTIKIGENTIHLFCNHFKSKGYGSPVSNNARRLKQSETVNKIIKQFDLKKEFVVVAGDLNDNPNSAPLAPLLTNSGLVNIVDLFGLENTGTYENKKDQFDYLLVSKALSENFVKGSIERRGIFSKSSDRFETVTSKANQASDHAAVWAEFDI
jgi:endonuclease/exonuclease/phosphatase family metal-dependent hydrolase